MNLKQLTLDQLKGLVLRLWPGLAGFHTVRYAQVKKVYEEAGKETPLGPLMAVDLQFCKHDFSLDIKHKVKKKVRLAGPSEFVQAPPKEGTYVLIHFPYWLCNTATVLAVLYLDRQVAPEADCVQIRDAEKVKISAKSELTLGDGSDQAVLGNELVLKLEDLIDEVSALGDEVINLGNGGVNLGTGVINAAASVATSIGLIKNDLEIVRGMLSEDVLSDIKLGMGCDVGTG